MITLRSPEVLDLAWVLSDLRPDHVEDHEELTGEQFCYSRVTARVWGLPGPKWGLYGDTGKPLGVAGLERKRPGVYRSWFYSTPDLWTQPDVSFVTESVIKQMLASDAHRIETIALEDRHQSRRWYERLGLRLETVLQGYGATGRNAVLYVATRPMG